jgi:transcriptional regulator with XRE-family HTH domain
MRRKSYPNLKAFFRLTGTRQIDFARQLGVTQPTISRYVNKGCADLNLSMRIAALANIPISSLLRQQDIKKAS